MRGHRSAMVQWENESGSVPRRGGGREPRDAEEPTGQSRIDEQNQRFPNDAPADTFDRRRSVTDSPMRPNPSPPQRLQLAVF